VSATSQVIGVQLLAAALASQGRLDPRLADVDPAFAQPDLGPNTVAALPCVCVWGLWS
jgi:hypothetical protein